MSKRRSVHEETFDQLSFYPYGVGQGLEGVCLLVEIGNHRLLFDCGLTDLTPLTRQTLPKIDLLVCTHAHADHAQGLLAFHKAFPQIPIYTSEMTAKLLSLHWPELTPGEIPSFCQVLEMRSPLSISPHLSLELFPAGHLPGAAAVSLTYGTPQRTYKLLYTGDFFLSNSRLVEGLSIEALKQTAPDVLIIEGSYGTARHSHRRQQENRLMERIHRALSNSENVLLPVPPLGLAQEILMLLRSHHQFTGRDLDIWVDGAIITGCDLYLELLPHLPASVQNFARHQPLFWDERVRPRMHRFTPERYSELHESPCVVVTETDADLRQYCNLTSGSWTVLLAEHPRVAIAPDPDSILASVKGSRLRIETYVLAEHSDGLGTTQLIHNLRPQHVIFIHGTKSYLTDLSNLEELQSRYHVHTPPAGTRVELPIGETFIQPAAPPESHYEGQIHELESDVTITLPNRIMGDPRWHNFADTGIVEAHWQGEELVLRGIPQRELLSQSSDAKILADVDCCGNCRYFQAHRCINSASPLYGFKVTPQGYCPFFEPLED